MQGHEEVEIIGNVGKDAEMRYTPAGVPVTSFNVAVNKKWKDSNTGEQREKTKWFRVTAWRGLAETCAQYVKQGMGVFVKGEVEAASFTDRDGNNRASLELTASKVQFLSSGRGDGESSGAQAVNGNGARATMNAGGGWEPPADDDLPF